SYLIESMTKDFDDKITEEIEHIDKMGGALRCTANGYIRKMMATDAYEWQQGVRKGEIAIVGVNCFTDKRGDTRPSTLYRTEHASEKQRVAAVKKLRRERDNRAAQKALAAVKSAASKSGSKAPSMMPSVITAVKAYCTTGEICGALRDVWGEFKPTDQPA
ncbi:MAG: methylmalonyl-CoA mutase family protein, partial [Pseudomonadota bacterium]